MKVTKRSQSSAIRCVNNGLVDSIKMSFKIYFNSHVCILQYLLCLNSDSMLQSVLNVF